MSETDEKKTPAMPAGEPADDPRFLSGPDVWHGPSLRPETFVVPITAAEIEELDRARLALATVDGPLGEIDIPSLGLDRLGRRCEAIRDELEGGRGFVVVRGLPVERWTKEETRRLFWVFSSVLGTPQTQDKAGNRIHEVTNTGLKVDTSSEVRSFQTDDELTFHNDGGDAFVLLCRRVARSGGMSKLVSAGALYNEVLRRRPDLIETLGQPFHFDTRGQHPLGLKIQSSPIFNLVDGRLSILYKRRYLLAAQRFPEVPRLSTAQQQAVELLEDLTNDPSLQLSFYMAPGDLQIANNYSVLHARTGYVDHEDPDARRHLFRTWLTLANGRRLPRAFALTREFRQSWLSREPDVLTDSITDEATIA